jgi:hypothetical protein
VVCKREIICFGGEDKRCEIVFGKDVVCLEEGFSKSDVLQLKSSVILKSLNKETNVQIVSIDSTFEVCLSLTEDLPPETVALWSNT